MLLNGTSLIKLAHSIDVARGTLADSGCAAVEPDLEQRLQPAACAAGIHRKHLYLAGRLDGCCIVASQVHTAHGCACAADTGT